MSSGFFSGCFLVILNIWPVYLNTADLTFPWNCVQFSFLIHNGQGNTHDFKSEFGSPWFTSTCEIYCSTNSVLEEYSEILHAWFLFK